MSLSMASLLLHSDDVPSGVRDAVRAAYDAPAEERTPYLESAARILHLEVELDCRDARELVGLSDGCDEP